MQGRQIWSLHNWQQRFQQLQSTANWLNSPFRSRHRLTVKLDKAWLSVYQLWFCGERQSKCVHYLCFSAPHAHWTCASRQHYIHYLPLLQGSFALAELFILRDSTFHQSTPPFSHTDMQLAVPRGSMGKNGIYSSASPPLKPVLTLHWGHFWAFLCPCSMTLAQVRSSLSPFLYSRHLSPLCQGAWHLKHHTNWQLLHWICNMKRNGYAIFTKVRGEIWICAGALILPCTCAQSGWSCAPSEWWTDYTEGTAWCWNPADSAPKSNDTLPHLPWTGWKSQPSPPGSRGTHRSDSWCGISQVSPRRQHSWGQEGQASMTAQDECLIFPIEHSSPLYDLLHKNTWPPCSCLHSVEAQANSGVCSGFIYWVLRRSVS